MRAVPPVDYPVSRQGLWDLAMGGLAAASAAVPVDWLARQLGASRVIGASDVRLLQAIALLLAVVAVAWFWRRRALAEKRSLRWDGQAWHEVDGEGGATELDTPSICIDLGFALLLRARLHPSGPLRWFPLERRSASGRWHALRVVTQAAGVATRARLATGAADGGQT
jgi:hypothetical protein